MRRGCVIEALRKFIISQGPSKNINNLEWASFWAENKKVIDPVAKRFTCISAKQRYPCSYFFFNDIVWSLLLFMEMASLRFLKSKRFLVTKRIPISETSQSTTPTKSLSNRKMLEPSKKEKRYLLPGNSSNIDHLNGLGKCNHSRNHC
jgi:hypothetical protein